MDDLKSFHYRFSKIVLSTIGLWPYDKSWLTNVKKVFVLATVVSFTTSLLTAYFLHQAKCSGILFINTLLYTLMTLIVILKYCVFWYHSNDMKSLVEMLQDSWRSLNNEDERQIIQKYAEKGKFQYTVITLFFYIPLCTDICMEITKSQNMDICESSMNLYTTVIYITVDKTYSRILSLQACSALIFGAMTISVTETTVTMIIYYITGLFEVIRKTVYQGWSHSRFFMTHTLCVTGKDCVNETCIVERNTEDQRILSEYRMRNVFNERIKTGTDETARERLINVARIHTRTIHICKKLNCLGFSYIVLLTLGTFVLITTLVRLSRTQLNELRALGAGIITLLTVCTYMFFCNHMVQTMMDSSAELLMEAYSTEWYNAPLSAQKMLLFIAQHCVNTYTFNLGGLFVPSYEGFSAVIKQSFSYFMVIRSTQM